MKNYPTDVVQPLGKHNKPYPCIKTEHVKEYIDLPFEYLNPLQSDFLPYLEDDEVNFVVAAPTSSGKTLVAELFMARSISLGKRILYIAPMKALADEKEAEWTNPKHSFSKYRTEVLTGDFVLDEKKKVRLELANIIILTPEMFNSKCRRFENHEWLMTTDLVVDECFPGNAKITVDKNIEVSIEKIYKNDAITHVLSYNFEKKIYEKKKILRKIKNDFSGEGLIVIDFDNGDNVLRKITCTKNHKIWVKDKGFIKAEDIKENDIIKSLFFDQDYICPICGKQYNINSLVPHYLDCHLDKINKCDSLRKRI